MLTLCAFNHAQARVVEFILELGETARSICHLIA